MIYSRKSSVLSNDISSIFSRTFGNVGNVFNLTLNQIIKSLFANNEQGFAYDPNDLSTMYQDAAGTVPVTGVGQAVGLMLDKSKGLTLSSELVLNGDFSSGATSWITSGTVTISGGVVNFNNAESGALVLQANPTNFIVGQLYKVTYTIISISGGSVSCAMGSNLGTIRATAGTYTEYIVAQSANVYIRARINGTTATIDNISVKGLAGNHAYQSTSSMRPLLVASPQRLDYDTVDDKLTTTLPAQLTGCTVIRAVPNVGTQILTNQTIPTPYNDNTDHCGLIVINRALTPSETSAITREFNKRAGV